MKKNVLLAIAAIALFALPALAQKPTRVNFKKGGHSAVLTGTLHNYEGKRVYLVRVREGQTMKVQGIGDKAVSIWVEGPPGSGYEQDLAADCHSLTEVSPTSKGDYKLTVQECSKVDRWKGTFKVRVTVK